MVSTSMPHRNPSFFGLRRDLCFIGQKSPAVINANPKSYFIHALTIYGIASKIASIDH